MFAQASAAGKLFNNKICYKFGSGNVKRKISINAFQAEDDEPHMNVPVLIQPGTCASLGLVKSKDKYLPVTNLKSVR